MKEFLVFGYGVSGKAATKLIRTAYENSKIWIVDHKKLELVGDLQQTTLETVQQIKLHQIIVSPGYLLNPAEQAYLKNKPWLTEFEFGLEHLKPQTVIAVTGTNGKSSVVKMLEHTLNACGVPAIAAGNIGTPVSLLAADKTPSDTVVILELSSYQLTYLKECCFEWGVITNITSDHLDWHGSLEKYQAAKSKLVLHSQQGCFLSSQAQAKLNPSVAGNPKLIPLADLDNAELVTEVLARAFPQLKSDLPSKVASFAGLEHRFEQVSTNPLIINDSKATNMDATFFALSRLHQPVVLLLGGTKKSGDNVKKLTKYQHLLEAVVLFGPLGAECRADFETLGVRTFGFTTLKKALLPENQKLWKNLDSRILFSPGGSSFDEFKSFHERGLFFKEALKEL